MRTDGDHLRRMIRGQKHCCRGNGLPGNSISTSSPLSPSTFSSTSPPQVLCLLYWFFFLTEKSLLLSVTRKLRYANKRKTDKQREKKMLKNAFYNLAFSDFQRPDRSPRCYLNLLGTLMSPNKRTPLLLLLKRTQRITALILHHQRKNINHLASYVTNLISNFCWSLLVR